MYQFLSGEKISIDLRPGNKGYSKVQQNAHLWTKLCVKLKQNFWIKMKL